MSLNDDDVFRYANAPKGKAPGEVGYGKSFVRKLGQGYSCIVEKGTILALHRSIYINLGADTYITSLTQISGWAVFCAICKGRKE